MTYVAVIRHYSFVDNERNDFVTRVELAFHPTVVAKHLCILLFSICHGVTMKYKSKITRFLDKFAVQSKVIVRLVITIGGRSIIH